RVSGGWSTSGLATPPARSRSASCATPTGRAATRRCNRPAVGVELREEPATAEAEVLGVWVTNQRRGRLLVRRARLVPAVAVELTEYALWTQAELEGLAGALLDELGGG